MSVLLMPLSCQTLGNRRLFKKPVGFDESFMYIVQTCHSDVKIHQLSEPIKPGAELNHPQLQL